MNIFSALGSFIKKNTSVSLALPLAVSLAWGSAAAVSAEVSGWESIACPDTKGGLVMCPKLLGLNKPFLAWGWTHKESKMEKPEFTFSRWQGDSWAVPRAPFFGKDIGNVRRVASAKAKHSVGIIYQRSQPEKEEALDVIYAISGDRGWSFSKPGVADSFVHEETVGTDVDIAGVGGKRPTFCFGWLAEARMVKAGILDPSYKGDRPRSNNLGHYGRGCERIELAGENEGGFVSVWNEGGSLHSARIKPLVGTAEESQMVETGKAGLNFDLTDYEGRNPMLVFDLAKAKKGKPSRRNVKTWKDGAWTDVAALPPAKGDFPQYARLQACQDEHNVLHVLSLSKDGETIYYSKLDNGKFTEPEKAMALKPMIGTTGFDLTYCDGYLYAVAAQGPYMQAVRKQVK